MYTKPLNASGALVLVVVTALVTVGCNQSETTSRRADEKVRLAKADEAKGGESRHSGWWCDEHGVPEGVCGQCNAKLAAEFKRKHDWCFEHDRPESQCFVHHPQLKEKFAAMYRAKYGKEPPPMEDEAKKDHKE